MFDYEHRFEAYLPKEKRRLGYFALPVLVGDEIVAAIDLKTDRERRKLLMQTMDLGRRGSSRSHKGASRRNCTASSASSSRDEAEHHGSNLEPHGSHAAHPQDRHRA